MPFISSFEILAENLVPTDIVPAGPENPFLIQGYFLQVSCVGSGVFNKFNLVFEETTKFTQGGAGSFKALNAQVIDASGTVQPYGQFFDSTTFGFLNQSISSGQTIIFGVQCLPQLLAATGDTFPQAGIGWRGSVRLEGATAGTLIATATQRLVYYEGTDPGTGPVTTASVYPVPTASGGTAL